MSDYRRPWLSAKTFFRVAFRRLIAKGVLKSVKVRIDRKRLFVYLVVLAVVAVLFYRYISTPGYDPSFVGTIYIRYDGSVEPSTSLIHRDGDLYTCIDNIHGSIVVERDNIVVDGGGYTVQGAGANDSKGIILSGRKNVTIRNFEIRAFWYGICFENSLDSSVSENNITASVRYGIWLRESSRNIISENDVRNNGHGVYMEYSSNNTLSGNWIADNSYGVYLYRSSNNTLSQNNVTINNVYGIWLHESSKSNIISGNSIIDNGYGIYFLRFSTLNSISGNNITANKKQGIWLHHSSKNILTGNSVANNKYGLYLSLGFLGGSSDNLIYHNNFVNNTDQIYIENATGTHLPPPPPLNVWDNGVEGNYWSDYAGTDKNRDGIGDSPYLIAPLESKQYDYHPLMGMFLSVSTSVGYNVNIISNSTIEYFAFFESNSTIKIWVSNMTANQTYGFCRIRVPHALMNETDHITIESVEPYYVNYTSYDDGYNRWIYFSYQHSTLLVIIHGCKTTSNQSLQKKTLINARND